MSDDDAKPDNAEPQGSVFGNLPESRPGTRSPRRDRGTAKRAAKPRAAKAKPAAAPKARPQPQPKAAPKPKSEPRDQAPKPPRASPPPTSADDRRDAADGDEGQRAGLEEIAWAGVAAAAEAATLGVKLANRALEALRGNSERG